MLEELQKVDNDNTSVEAPKLPRTAKELQHIVQVLLKTNHEEKRSSLKSFVHQATVRRDKVIRCILEFKRLGHRAYLQVDEEAMREKAKALPLNGIPPEVVHLLPNDSSMDKLQVQKAATPVEGRSSLENIHRRLQV